MWRSATPIPRQAALVALGVVMAACTYTSTPIPASQESTSRHQRSAPSRQALHVSVHQIGRLPDPVQDPATASRGHTVYALGGLDAADSSVSTVLRVLPRPAVAIGNLALPTHDAAAAAPAGRIYLFGGGHLTSYNTILRLDPSTGSLGLAAHLPVPLSDISATVIADTAYIVGGYTGSEFSDRILSFRGGKVRVAGHLPIGLRYTAVGASRGALLIAGGLSSSGPTRDIYRFSPADHTTTKVGELPYRLMHAGSGSLHGVMCIVGGLGRQLSPHREILSVGVHGSVHIAGSLSRGLSDSGVTRRSGQLIVVGGRDKHGPVSSVLAVSSEP